MVRCAKDLLALKKNGAGAWGRLLFIHDNQESCINRLLKINSNNGRVSPVAWRLMELTTMINYHLPHSREVQRHSIHSTSPMCASPLPNQSYAEQQSC